MLYFTHLWGHTNIYKYTYIPQIMIHNLYLGIIGIYVQEYKSRSSFKGQSYR